MSRRDRLNDREQRIADRRVENSSGAGYGDLVQLALDRDAADQYETALTSRWDT